MKRKIITNQSNTRLASLSRRNFLTLLQVAGVSAASTNLGSIAFAETVEKDLPAKKKSIPVSKQFLILPIQNKKTKLKPSKFRLVVEGKPVIVFDMVIATTAKDIDWYGFVELEQYQGKTIQITATNASEEGFSLIKQSDSVPGEDNFYNEKYRPQYHFTSKTGWLNDPNGMIYYQGEYHLFYQHNPVGIHWGNMTWGHATSKDMLHWIEQPKVLFPNDVSMCFSGATFVDDKNLLGLKTGDNNVLVAFYLRTYVGLCLAYSNNGGQTFTDYEDNPVLTHDGDRLDTPRPFFYEPTQRWVAPTYDFFTNDKGKKLRCVGFYSSKNLKDWKYESRVEQDKWGDELCGCVDFFQLPIDGDEHNKKWVMIMIDGSYIIGTFNGSVFYNLAGKPAITKDRIKTLVKEGNFYAKEKQGNFYATMTFHDAPDGRRVQLTWMRGRNYPAKSFNQQMTAPSEITLHSTAEGLRLRMKPIDELSTLRTQTHNWDNTIVQTENNLLTEITGDLFDIEVEFEPEQKSQLEFDLRGIKVVYNAKNHTLNCNGTMADCPPVNGKVHLRILLDRSSIETYVNNGRIYIPQVVFPDEHNNLLSLKSVKNQVKINTLRVHELKSSWT